MTMIQINGNDLTLEQIVMVARNGYKVELTKQAEEREFEGQTRRILIIGVDGGFSEELAVGLFQ